MHLVKESKVYNHRMWSLLLLQDRFCFLIIPQVEVARTKDTYTRDHRTMLKEGIKLRAIPILLWKKVNWTKKPFQTIKNWYKVISKTSPIKIRMFRILTNFSLFLICTLRFKIIIRAIHPNKTIRDKATRLRRTHQLTNNASNQPKP